MPKPPRDPDRNTTLPVTSYIAGNGVFDRTVFAIGLDGTTSRHLVAEALKLVGGEPKQCTMEEIAGLLPELERRVRLLVPPHIADGAIARVRKMIIDWDE